MASAYLRIVGTLLTQHGTVEFVVKSKYLISIIGSP